METIIRDRITEEVIDLIKKASEVQKLTEEESAPGDFCHASEPVDDPFAWMGTKLQSIRRTLIWRSYSEAEAFQLDKKQKCKLLTCFN